MITELYVPRPALAAFLAAVRADFRQHGAQLIYGTIRLIERDDESFLAWAREPWVCTVMNLHVDHDEDGLAKAAGDFRRLIDRAIEHGGSYFLTYHRWATRAQVEACHPQHGRVPAAQAAATTRTRCSRATGIGTTSRCSPIGFDGRPRVPDAARLPQLYAFRIICRHCAASGTSIQRRFGLRSAMVAGIALAI